MIEYGPYIAQAPLAIAVVIDRTRFALSDGSRAIQSMVLTAWDEGIGSNWVGFMGPDEVKPVLGIPEDRDLLAIVPFGYPDAAHGQGTQEAQDRRRGRVRRTFRRAISIVPAARIVCGRVRPGAGLMPDRRNTFVACR